MTRTTMTITMAAAAVAVLAGTAPASAMQQEVAVATFEAPPSDRAEALRAEAESLFSTPTKWRRAARLLEQSAQLRDASDAEAYTCLIYAGRLRAGMGDYAGARQVLEKAAAHAVARGAVLDAAHAYIDAAHAAVEEKDVRGAQSLLDRATLLSQSPLLTAEQSRQITRRVTG